MIEEAQKPNIKNKKIIPKGCFDADQLQKYLLIKNYLLLKDMYNIVCPFKYQFLSYVIVKSKNENEGEVLELYHETFRKLILRAVPKNRQIGCKYQIYCPNENRLVASLRGDLMGNKFNLFDGGHNPNKKKFPTRKQLAYVYTNSTQFFSQKPPTLNAILANHGKRVSNQSDDQNFGNLFQAQGILQIQSNSSQLVKAEKQNSKRVFTISSVQPVYCPNKKGYMMDLKGLISEPSTLNLVMKTKINEDCIVMGKRSENTYLIYVGTPLTLVQGFGIFLANFSARKQ